MVPYFDPVLQVHIHVVSLTTSQEGAYVIDNRSSLNKRLHSKSFVNHIFAFLLAGSTLLLYIATLFSLNQFDTSFFKFGHFKESNYQTDMGTLLGIFFTASKQTAKCSSIGRSGNEGDFRGEAGLRCAQMVIRMYSGVLMAIYIVAKLIQSLFVVHNRQLTLY